MRALGSLLRATVQPFKGIGFRPWSGAWWGDLFAASTAAAAMLLLAGCATLDLFLLPEGSSVDEWAWSAALAAVAPMSMATARRWVAARDELAELRRITGLDRGRKEAA